MGTKKKPVIKFKGFTYYVEFGKYQADGKTIAMWCEEVGTGEPGPDITKFIQNVHLREDEVLVKNYSENEGLLQVLINAGIVEWKNAVIPTGFVNMHLCKLLVDPRDYQE